MTMTRGRRRPLAGLILVVTGVVACSDGGQDVPEAPTDVEATVALIDDAVTGGDRRPDDETAEVYAEVGADRLGDFARHDTRDDPARVEGGRVAIGSVPATRFLALGMTTGAGRDRLLAAHATVALDIAVAGVATENGGDDTPWEAELAKLDAIVAAAHVVGGDVSPGQANEIVARARDDERTVVATAHLVDALRAEAAERVRPAHQQVLDVAATELSADSLGELRRMATSPGESPDAVDGLDDLAVGSTAVGSTAAGDLAAEIDDFREVFAGHEELPVEADVRDASSSFRSHLEPALDALHEEG